MIEDAQPNRYYMKDVLNDKIWERKSEIITYLNDNICGIRSVSDLSDAFGYSREHFSRFVSRYFGVSCKRLIDQVRLSYAINQIRFSQKSLEEISDSAGFPSYRNFIQICKKWYGFPPGRFNA